MKYQDLIDALNMIWEEKPRLDILACREEAYLLLEPVIKKIMDYTLENLQEQTLNLTASVFDDVVSLEDALEDGAIESTCFGIDLYLAYKLAEGGKLTKTSLSVAEVDKLFPTIENKELQVKVFERFELVPLILQDYTCEYMEQVVEDIPYLADRPWSVVEDLRQTLLAVSTTTFLLAAIYLGSLA